MDAWKLFILRCLAIGIQPKQIAVCAGVSLYTMHKYLYRLRRRMGVRHSWEIVPKLLEGAE